MRVQLHGQLIQRQQPVKTSSQRRRSARRRRSSTDQGVNRRAANASKSSLLLVRTATSTAESLPPVACPICEAANKADGLAEQVGDDVSEQSSSLVRFFHRIVAVVADEHLHGVRVQPAIVIRTLDTNSARQARIHFVHASLHSLGELRVFASVRIVLVADDEQNAGDRSAVDVHGRKVFADVTFDRISVNIEDGADVRLLVKQRADSLRGVFKRACPARMVVHGRVMNRVDAGVVQPRGKRASYIDDMTGAPTFAVAFRRAVVFRRVHMINEDRCFRPARSRPSGDESDGASERLISSGGMSRVCTGSVPTPGVNPSSRAPATATATKATKMKSSPGPSDSVCLRTLPNDVRLQRGGMAISPFGSRYMPRGEAVCRPVQK